MSVHSAQEHSAAGRWEDAEEIDLTRYLNALWNRRLEILLTTLAVMVLTGVGVSAYLALTPPLYEATATVAIVRTMTDVQFDERYTTSSEAANLDVNSRRTALIALVGSGSIAQEVVAELGDALPPNLQSPTELLRAVEGEMATVNGSGQSDLINIIVRSEAPELSAQIANTWAKAYVQQVNSVYGQVPDEIMGTVAAQLTEAQQSYAEAQARLENHLATSPLEALMRQTAAISSTVNALQGSQLRMYHDQWLRTSSLLAAARGLSAQLEGEGEVDTTGTSLALQALKVQIVNSAAAAPPPGRVDGDQPQQQQQQPPTTLQLQLNSGATVTAAELRAQAAATVAGLEVQMALLEERIAQATQVLATGSALPAASAADGPGAATTALPDTIAQLEEQARMLLTQVEVETARTLEYTQQRDIAWESVEALGNKQAELMLARAAANSEVRLSSAAVPLLRPVEQVSLVISLVLAALAGLLLGILVALGLELANIPPLRRQRKTA